VSTNHDPNSVRDLAYQLWVERGQPEGNAEADWYEAERRLRGERTSDSQLVDEAVKESFPASDPPASGLPDKPPANAEEKWRVAEESSPTQPGAAATTDAPDTSLPPVKAPKRGTAAKGSTAKQVGARKPRETTSKLGSRDAPGG
jgi:hypothetical protein